MKSTKTIWDILLWSCAFNYRRRSRVRQPIGTEVSEERVMECFLNDLQIADDECCGLYGADFWCDFPQEVREILLNMMFNMGRPDLANSKK